MRRKSFEHFYYTKVAMGEGCGCAERVIDNHEMDRLTSRPRRPARPLFRPGRWLARALARLRAIRRARP